MSSLTQFGTYGFLSTLVAAQMAAVPSVGQGGKNVGANREGKVAGLARLRELGKTSRLARR